MTKPISYTVADAQAASGVGKTSIYAAIKDGALPCRKFGKKTLILADDLEAWVKRMPVREIRAAA